MDGALPTVPNFQQPAAGAAPAAPPAPPGAPAPAVAGSPGKPYTDPEKQNQRDLKHQEKQRLESILPAAAKEGHFAVFELKGRTGRHIVNASKPVMTVLLSEIENSGVDVNDHIMDELDSRDKSGRFLIMVRDKHSKKITEYPEWEIGSDDEYEDDVDPAQNGGYGYQYGAPVPPAGYQQPLQGPLAGYNPHTPPPPPPYGPEQPPEDDFNQADFITTTRDLLSDEHEKSTQQTNDMVGMLTTMMNAQQQTQAQMQHQTQILAQQSDDRRREDENRRREEQDRRDERIRQERADEKSGRITLIATLAPLLMPLVEKVMNGKPDVMMPMLLKMMDSSQNTDAMKVLMEMQSEGARQTMTMYADANKSVQESQAKATGHLMTSFMETSTMVTKAAIEAAKDDSDDPLDKFARLATMAAPILKSMASQAPATVMPPPDPTLIPVQSQPVQPAAPDPLSGTPIPSTDGAQPVNAEQPAPNKDQLIEGVMTSVMRLHKGELPETERPQMTVWAEKEMRERIPDLYKAVMDQDIETVYSLGGPIVAENETLFEWLTNGGDEFLTDFLEGVRVQVQGEQITDSAELTQEDIDEVNNGILRAPPPPVTTPDEETPDDEQPKEGESSEEETESEETEEQPEEEQEES